MDEKVIFGLHTMEFKHQISRNEADIICSRIGDDIYGEANSSGKFFTEGFTKLWIDIVKGKERVRYYIHAVINFSRAVGGTGNQVMPYTKDNIRRFMTKANRVLRCLKLQGNNSKVSDWTVGRLDSGFDIYTEAAELLLPLMARTLDLGDAKRRCSYIPTDTPESTMRFGNNSYVYNIYIKGQEMLRRGKAFTDGEMEELRCLLRIERQNRLGAVKKLLPNNKVGDLADNKVREGILRTMMDDISAFFGEADYYSWEEIERLYRPKRWAEVEAVKDIMARITSSSLLDVGGAYTKDIKEAFARLDIAPSGIRKEEVKLYGIGKAEGPYNRIAGEYPRPREKRAYGEFPTPHMTGDGRCKATITLYSCSRGGAVQYQAAGRTIEEYEEKVLQKLQETFLLNCRFLRGQDADQLEIIRKSQDSIVRFRKVAVTEKIRDLLDGHIERNESILGQSGKKELYSDSEQNELF